MAIVIKPKRSETADSAPGTSDIVDGEIAVNIADKKIYIRHSDDTIVTLSDGANLTSGSTSTIDATTDIILDADGGDIFFKDGGTTFGSATNTSGNLIIKSGTTTAATFSGANVTLAGTLGVGAITGTSTIQGTTITATTAFVPDASDGAALGSASLEFSDLYLADGAVIGFGDDQDVTLTHVADAGLLLNSSMYLTFRDSALKISSSADGQLDIDADTEVEITATTVDLNGNLDVSGTYTGGGLMTTGGNICLLYTSPSPRDATLSREAG